MAAGIPPKDETEPNDHNTKNDERAKDVSLRDRTNWRLFSLRPRPSYLSCLQRLLGNCVAFEQDREERVAAPTFNALASLHDVGVIHLAALRTYNVDHGCGALCSKRRTDNILFWDI